MNNISQTIIIITLFVMIYLVIFYMKRGIEKFSEEVDISAWKKLKIGKLSNLSLSGNKLCGVNKDNNIYCSNFGYDDWQQIQGNLKQLSLDGRKVCGVTSIDDIYCADDIDNPAWQQLNGKLKQVSLSGDTICGVNSENNIYCSDYYKTDWKQLPGRLNNLSIDGARICGVNENDDIYCADNLIDPEWAHVNGKLKQISLSGDTMCGINKDNELYCADYAKDNWKRKPGELAHVSVDGNKSYAVDDTDNIYYTYDINRLRYKPPVIDKPVIKKQKTETIFTKEGEQLIKDKEDAGCKLIKNTLQNDKNNYDVSRNYILVNSPNRDEEDICYIKDLKTVTQGPCDMNNLDLYDPDNDNFIEDVYPNRIGDKYVSTTLPQSACIYKFKDGTPNPENVKTFINRLDTSAPVLQGLNKDMKNIYKKRNIITFKDKKLESQIVSMKNTTATKDKEIENKNNVISSLDSEIRNRQNKVQDLKNRIANVGNQYEDVSKKTIQVCKDADYNGKCTDVPLGMHDVHSMRLLGIPNDSISSVKVPNGLVARFYYAALQFTDKKDTNKNNKYIEVDGRNIPNIGGESWADGTNKPSINDAISSIIVQTKPFDQNAQAMNWDF